jgi:hypothetical protein
MDRRTSSLDRGPFTAGGGRRDSYSSTDSESFTSSRDHCQGRRKSIDRRDKHQGRRRSSSSSTSLDDISSSEDERRVRKIKGKEILTAGLAAVATINAGAKVYSSLEATHRRHRAVREGKITQNEADKQKHRARFQEAAAIGMAALGIKALMGNWKDVNKAHKSLKEQKHARERRRIKKLEEGRSRSSHGERRYSDPDLRYR